MSDLEGRYERGLRQALDRIRELRAERDALAEASAEPIAVVGIGCRFPGGGDGPEACWRQLEGGVDAVGEIPATRWSADEIPGGRSDTRRAALLEQVDQFDADFFGIAPREAESLDPQQRLLLETAWEALEEAGQPPEIIERCTTGVFLGMYALDYNHRILRRGPRRFDAYCATGNLLSTAAGRISYVLGLTGPSITVDTACSSSLVAVALACQSLRAGECDVALAGGVSLILSPTSMAMLATTQALSPEGRCRTFDARADGIVRGEGCGVVVLKRLGDARRDGDPIRGLLRGWAVNQDGRSAGLTVPSPLAQERLLRRALGHARVAPEAIGYVELHGTGTPVGDPIEAEALRAVLGAARPDGTPCVLGALKTNYGHMEAAAGVGGLIKVLLALEHEQIPRNLHFERLNPRISLAGTPFVIPTENVPWPRGAAARLAGVSSFGISGTNAHLIVEEAPAPAAPVPASSRDTSYLVPLSARSPVALAALARAYGERLADPGAALAVRDLAHTTGQRRAHHPHRIAVTGRTRQEIAGALAAAASRIAAGVAQADAPAGRPRVVFVYPGQGSQWQGMGRQLLEEEPAFRLAIEAADEAIRREAGFSVLTQICSDDAPIERAEIDVAQPVLFAVQLAIAALWRAYGVAPDAVIGHSMGEIAAAYEAGLLDLRDAARVICRRSRLLRVVQGKAAMALVALDAAAAQDALADRAGQLSVAARNGPRTTVIAGDAAALEQFLETLEGRGVFCRRVKSSAASHCPQVDALVPELRAALRDLRPGVARVRMQSTVTGAALPDGACDAAYWARNLRDPVLFQEASQRLMGAGDTVFIEVSPHPVLLQAIEDNLREAGRDGVALPSVHRDADERRRMQESLGALYAHGFPVDWSLQQRGEGRCVALPRYPFQRRRYWIEPAPSSAEDEGIYEVAWRRSAPPADPGGGGDAAGAWLLFEDLGGVGAALAAALAARGQAVVRARPGRRFARLGPAWYEFDPASPGDLRALLDEAFPPDLPCRGIVHLLSLDVPPWPGGDMEARALDQQGALLSALHLVQALVGRVLRPSPRVLLVTRGAQAVQEEPVTGVAQAALWGLCSTMALEHPELGCAALDLETRAGAEAVAGLLGELVSPDGERRIAHRGGHRYVARLVRGGLGGAAPPLPKLEPDASYLVTGGLGGLGLAVAGWLVERGARRVALLGRRPPGAAATEQIRAMEAQGARVLVLAADVSKAAAVEAALGEIRRELPPLRGIVHAAGLAETMPISELSPSSLERVLAPKLLGALHLHAATQAMPLDFFVLYSSASALLGLAGQAAYAAANATLDALSRARRGLALPCLSIRWGAFSQAGMAARSGKDESAARVGMESLSPAEGCAVLGRLLARPPAETMVARLSVPRLLEALPQLAQDPFFCELAPREEGPAPPSLTPAPGAAAFQETLAAAPEAERAGLLVRQLQEQIGAVLRLDPAQVRPERPFHQYGFDSLMALELRNRLQCALGLPVSVSEVLAHARADQLAVHLGGRLSPAAAQGPAAPPPRRPAARSERPEDWVLTPKPRPGAALRLFCFPYAGGAASLFAGWPKELPPHIEVCAIQLPGRQERLSEAPLDSVPDLVAALVPPLLTWLDRPYAMFGHCLGAILMFEVLQRLAARGAPLPVHIFPAGAPSPPRYIVPEHVGAQAREEPLGLLRSMGYAGADLLADEDARRHFGPAVAADFKAGVGYRYSPAEPLAVPLTTLAGAEDTFAPPEAVRRWEQLSRAPSSHLVLPGGHYFVTTERSRLLSILTEQFRAADQPSTTSATRGRT